MSMFHGIAKAFQTAVNRGWKDRKQQRIIHNNVPGLVDIT